MKLVRNNKYVFKYPYFVNENGEVFSQKTNKFMKQHLDKDGYAKVRLTTEDGRHTFSVHRLVLEAFSPREDMNQLQVNHIDGDKLNNRLSNLEWTTCQENIQHAMKTGLRKNTIGENNNAPHFLIEKQVKEIIQLLLSHSFTNQQIAKKYNVNITAIERIKYKKTWKYLTEDIDFYKTFND